VKLDGGQLPNFSKVPQRHWQNQVLTNQFLYALLAEENDENGKKKWSLFFVDEHFESALGRIDSALVTIDRHRKQSNSGERIL